jgi:sarcosine oxidase subunit alpha
MSTLKVGRARYGLMLREDGFVMDDGTVSRLADDHFVLTTTSANAGPVMAHLEFCHAVLWPGLDLSLVSVSEHWAQYGVAGPRSRDLLRRVIDRACDISNAALPYMGVTAVKLDGGVKGRLFRISFSGELAYEIAVPACSGDALARNLLDKGGDLGAILYGIDALNVMRIEKGHAAGGELNGQTTAGDLGLGRMMVADKDFIGRVMARRPALVAPDRRVLVGLRAVGAGGFGAGAHLIARAERADATHDQGHITSACWSPTLAAHIGLALLRRGRERLGETLRAYDPIRGRDTPVVVCDPVFLDPEGARLRA